MTVFGSRFHQIPLKWVEFGEIPHLGAAGAPPGPGPCLNCMNYCCFEPLPREAGSAFFSWIPAFFRKTQFSRDFTQNHGFHGDFNQNHIFSPEAPKSTNLAFVYVAQINAPRQGPRKAPKSPKSTNLDRNLGEIPIFSQKHQFHPKSRLWAVKQEKSAEKS